MKQFLLFAFLLVTFSAAAQDTTKIATDTAKYIIVSASIRDYDEDDAVFKQRRFDIGGGVQVNVIAAMTTFAGPSFSFKANSRYGRLAGIFNMSYNFGNTFKALSFSYYNNGNSPGTRD